MHANELVLGEIVPAEVDTPFVLCRNISCNDILSVWDEVVKVRWRNIYCILAIVPRVVRIVRIGVIYRLF